MGSRWRLAIVALCLGIFLLTGCGTRHNIPARPADSTPLTPASRLTETVVLPHLEGTITPGVNYVFCVTFQLAWNELAKSTVNSAIQLEGGPSWIDVLNQGRHAPSGLSQNCYLSMGGFVRDGIVQRIRNEMSQRFPNAQLTVPEPPASTVAYIFAYLEKSLSFGEAFDRSDGMLRWPLGGNLAPVSSFGSADFCSGTRRYDAIVEQVTILDYANDDDFVLKLNSSSRRDEIILAKIQPQVTLRETIESVESRINKSSLDEYARKPQTGESLVVPIIRVDTLRVYDEIRGKPFLNPGLEGLYIAEAQQGIRFRLDEWGARLESSGELAAASELPETPRHFHFDKPFLVYLKERSAAVPYFAVWVETAEVLEPLGGLK